MIIAATGHRPNKLGGYSDAIYNKLVRLAILYLKENKPTGIISGMALGWDQAWCEAGQTLRIQVTAALPCDNQHLAWPSKSQVKYIDLLSNCTHIINVSPGPYEKWKMQKRNMFMVSNCNKLAALWDGSPGGTGNCIRYAEKCNLPIDNLWSRWDGRIP